MKGISRAQQIGSQCVYCFNPFCSNSFSRVHLTRDESLRQHKIKCGHWMIDNHQIDILKYNLQNKGSSEREELLLYSFPIQSLLSFYSHHEKMRVKLAQVYDEAKKQICQFFDQSKKMKLFQFDTLKKEIDQFKQVIISSIDSMTRLSKQGQSYQQKMSWNINSYLQKSEYFLDTFKNYLFFDNQSIKEQNHLIKEQINILNKKVCQQMEIKGEFQSLKYPDMLEVQKIFNEPCFNYIQRIKQITNWELQQLIHQNYDQYLIQCPLCDYNSVAVSSPLIIKNHQLCKEFSEHLFIAHLSYLTMKYSYRISKKSVSQTTMADVIYIMQKYNYTTLDVYDASQSKGLNLNNSPNTFTLSVVSEANFNMSELESKYLVINSVEQGAYILVIILLQVSSKMNKMVRIINFKKQYYALFSKMISNLKLNAVFETARITKSMVKSIIKAV